MGKTFKDSPADKFDTYTYTRDKRKKHTSLKPIEKDVKRLKTKTRQQTSSY